eukprot:TRINITY_DN13837_c0_g1_i2.p1 TRINITY_DN13837_c0_g1~~TRINITY_DN13837_c0_g1_i2.p1  ORF type:complete len:145 (-),score=34.69 TRINITY_DN13837_c0_g1_i2:34-468(-)
MCIRDRPNSKLRKEFLEQLAIIKTKIRKKLKGKVVNGRRINGPMMANLCEIYTETINKGRVPSVEDAWSYVCRSQCETALSEVQKHYEESVKLRLLSKVPLSKEEIKRLLKEVKCEAAKIFKSKLIGELPVSYTHLTLPTICSV